MLKPIVYLMFIILLALGRIQAHTFTISANGGYGSYAGDAIMDDSEHFDDASNWTAGISLGYQVSKDFNVSLGCMIHSCGIKFGDISSTNYLEGLLSAEVDYIITDFGSDYDFCLRGGVGAIAAFPFKVNYDYHHSEYIGDGEATTHVVRSVGFEMEKKYLDMGLVIKFSLSKAFGPGFLHFGSAYMVTMKSEALYKYDLDVRAGDGSENTVYKRSYIEYNHPTILLTFGYTLLI